MKGYPKTLSSKKDYLYVREHFSREQWLPDFQALLDSYQDWFFGKHLETKDEGIEDDTHKIIKFENIETKEKLEKKVESNKYDRKEPYQGRKVEPYQ